MIGENGMESQSSHPADRFLIYMILISVGVMDHSMFRVYNVMYFEFFNVSINKI